MATESFANNATTTLSGTITSGASSLVVTSAATFPLSPQFRLLIDSEFLLVTAMTGTTFTVTRGVEGSTAAAHSNGATVSHVLTSGGLIGAAGLINPDGVYSGIPAAGTVGRLFIPSDGGGIFRDGGSSWSGFGPLAPMTPPVLSQFTFVNQGTGSSSGNVSQNTGSPVILWSGASAGAAAIRALVQAAPATPYSLTTFIRCNIGNAGFNQFGIGFRRSTGGSNASGFITLNWVYNNGSPIWQFSKWTSATVFSADYVANPADARQFNPIAGFWLRLTDDGTNIAASVSADGIIYQTVRTVSRTDFFGSGPDQLCFLIEPEANYVFMTIYHWATTSP